MRRVIVNSTPIITLCNIGKLHLLKDLLGVLLKAKQQGYLDNVKECLRKMQAAGFYISPKIVKLVLEQAHENHSYVIPNNSHIVSEDREPYGKIK